MFFQPFFSSLDWNLCGYVFGDFADTDSSIDGIFNFNHCIRIGILHCFVKVKGKVTKYFAKNIII